MKFLNRIYNHIVAHKKIYFTAALILTFIVLALSVYVVPYDTQDDTVYQLNLITHERLKSFWEILPSVWQHWHDHTGRLVNHFFLQCMMLAGKKVTSAVYSLIVILIAFLISKTASDNNKMDPVTVLLVLGLFYYFNPIYEETLLWVTGFANYTFPVLLDLAFLYLFTLRIRNQKANVLLENPVTLALIGILAGWTTEAMSCSMTFCSFFLLIYMYRKKQLKAEHITGWLGLAFGCLMLMIAPGNQERLGYVETYLDVHSLYGYGIRAFTFLEMVSRYAFPTLIALFSVFLFTDHEALKKSVVSIFYLAVGIISLLAMLGSPINIAHRTFNPTMLVLFVPMIFCLNHIKGLDAGKKNIVSVAVFLNFLLINFLNMLFTATH